MTHFCVAGKIYSELLEERDRRSPADSRAVVWVKQLAPLVPFDMMPRKLSPPWLPHRGSPVQSTLGATETGNSN